MNNNNKKNIFITGATSFLGRNVCIYFIKQGYNVFALTRTNSENNNKLHNIVGLNIIPIDIDDFKESEIQTFDSEYYKNELVKNSIINIKNNHNYFIHYAWKGTSRVDRKNEDIQKYNLSQSIKWLKIASVLGVEKFVFAGSQAEYSDNYYGIYKNKFAEYAKEFIKNNKMTFIHMRIFSIFGSDDRKEAILSALLYSIKDNKDFDLTNCNIDWNFLYINDYVKIIEKIISKKEIYKNECENKLIEFDVASDDTRNLRKLIEEAHAELNSKIKLNFGAKEDSKDIFAIPDIKALMNYIGEYEFIEFKKAILDMYNKI